ncbi:MAG: hypothetical protein ACYDCQ_17875, partial [Dehalococcoidia bacterium]
MSWLRRPPTGKSLLIILALAATAIVSPPRGSLSVLPAAASTLDDGCGMHSTYPAACAIGPGAFDDALTGPDYVNFYRIALPTAGQALRIELQRSLGLQAALIRDSSGMTGPLAGGLANARPEYAVDDFGPEIANESVTGGAPPASVAPYPAPFQSVPFQSVPFQSVPFQSVPFQSVPFQSVGFEASAGEHPDFRPIQLVGLSDGSTDQQTLTHFSDALDGADVRTAELVLAVWSTGAENRQYGVTTSYLTPEDTCAPGLGALPALPDTFAPLGSAAPSVPDGVSTLVLTNEARLTQLYGSDGDQAVMNQLGQLAASPQVNGAVLSVDADPGVAAAYANWDANQCSATLANTAAAAVKRLVSGFVAANPTVRYIVLVGSDAVLPYFRIADDARIANEVQYAGQTGLSTNSSEEAAFVRRNLMTDDYYADPHGEISGSRLLFGPQIALGRLVESPAEITAAVQTFLSQNGVLNAASGLVTGYDFLRDTADSVAQIFAGHLTPLTDLNSDGWSAADVDAALNAQSNGPDVVFF